MRILLVLALSTALTGQLFFARTLAVCWNGRHLHNRLSTEKLQTYAGLYDFPQIHLTFRVWVKDGALYVQSANRPDMRSALLPMGDDHFISREGGDAECWFDPNAGTLTFRQHGRTFTGKKTN